MVRSTIVCLHARGGKLTCRVPTEHALPQTPLVSLLLRAKIQDIRMEVEALTQLLAQDQDPARMSVIQELIGVRFGRARLRAPAGSS